MKIVCGKAAFVSFETMWIEAEDIDFIWIGSLVVIIVFHKWLKSDQLPPRLMGVLGRLLQKGPNFSSGRNT